MEAIGQAAGVSREVLESGLSPAAVWHEFKSWLKGNLTVVLKASKQGDDTAASVAGLRRGRKSAVNRTSEDAAAHRWALTEAEYLKLGGKQSNFSADVKRVVYAMFERYSKVRPRINLLCSLLEQDLHATILVD